MPTRDPAPPQALATMAKIKKKKTTSKAPARKRKKIESSKKAKSAFVLWAHAGARDTIKAEHPEWSLVDVGRALCKSWHALSKAAKKPYSDLAAEDKKRFDAENAA